jgi:hypothetical protein
VAIDTTHAVTPEGARRNARTSRNSRPGPSRGHRHGPARGVLRPRVARRATARDSAKGKPGRGVEGGHERRRKLAGVAERVNARELARGVRWGRRPSADRAGREPAAGAVLPINRRYVPSCRELCGAPERRGAQQPKPWLDVPRTARRVPARPSAHRTRRAGSGTLHIVRLSMKHRLPKATATAQHHACAAGRH